jgi:hypothetical protein
MRRARWILAVLAAAVFAAWAPQAPAERASRGAETAVTVASGATKIARWELYVRSPRPGRRCVGMRVGSLFDESDSVTRERCGRRGISRAAVTLHTLASSGMGSFAFGRAGRGVGQVSVTVADRAPVTVGTLASPLGGRDRVWVAHAGLSCAPVSVRALGSRGNAPGGGRSGRIGPPGCG